MESNHMNTRDEVLWNKAQQRTKFKSSLISYFVVNCLLIALWAVGDRDHFWPKWVLLFWGIGLVVKYLKSYLMPGVLSTEKEYEKLTTDKNR